MMVGESAKIVVRAINLNGLVVTDPLLDETPVVEVSNAGMGTVTPGSVLQNAFWAGEATVNFTAQAAGSGEIHVRYHGQVFQSPTLTVNQPAPAPTSAPAPVEPASSAPVSAGTTTPEVVPTPAPAPPAPVPAPVPAAPTPVPVPVPEPAPVSVVVRPFADIPAESPYFEALTQLKAAGLVAGYSDNTFKPDQEVSRAEAITFILRALDEKVKEDVQKQFPDVSLESWYSKFVFTAFQLGFVKGYPDGSFRPDAKVTVSEFFTMFFLAAKTDVDPQIVITLPQGVTATDWFAPYLQEAIRKNMLVVENNKVDAAKPLTRGEIAKILYQLKQLEEKPKN